MECARCVDALLGWDKTFNTTLPKDSIVKVQDTGNNYKYYRSTVAKLRRDVNVTEDNRWSEILLWDNATSYSLDAYVVYANEVYRSLNNNNLGLVPSSNTNNWKKVSVLDWNNIPRPSLSSMFQITHSFNQPIDKLNTTGITNFKNVFDQAKLFNQPLSWDTSSATDMSYMFHKANKFNLLYNFQIHLKSPI